MIRAAFLAMALAVFPGCADEQKAGAPEATPDPVKRTQLQMASPDNKQDVHLREQGDLTYSVNLLPAIGFIERSGDVIDPADRNELESEQVLLFECSLKDPHKDFWKYKGLQMEQEDGMNYLAGQIASDVTVQQNGRIYEATAVNFEGRPGTMHKIRVQLFFRDLDLEKPLKVLYYDRLAGSGLIKFQLNER